ncbi:hypothetical protein [Lentzea flaviverrucosa]|uniref:Uncharacterized protein n=1 Tax=Lentzea flaviverrucosa TaxID=200379 RepID=A0A1H9CD41_9PSEU|nr:hypothetical protein [Lentzea flaviverrucosa]RDI24515.1 hypothetical protein DFR72_10995 [Lentzea flaviverrucosa]SEP99079.1 hypothetical protein SAMN05216195_101750 [Lentzea flaviverrucosa]
MTEEMNAVRRLAAEGLLAKTAAEASVQEHRRLRAAVYAIAHTVVFTQLTRKLELKRGHRGCARSVLRLEAACLDRFHDDMDAVLDDVFLHATMPVHNLEGWVHGRLRFATINAYRRRRGERGALQKPRVPRWLATALGEEPRLITLAVDLLEFVGNDSVAGAAVWPVEWWAEHRAILCGDDYESAYREVVRDVETVLAAMRSKPRWYADYVERPLGHKEHSAVPLPRTSSDGPDLAHPDGDPFRELASVALRNIGARVALGENPAGAATDVVTEVFVRSLGSDELDRTPGAAAWPPEFLARGLAERTVLELLEAAARAEE